MFDRWYEDLEVGQPETYYGITLTEAHVVMFAGVTGDFNPTHTDADFCRQTPLGKRIPHALLVLSSALGRAPIDPDGCLSSGTSTTMHSGSTVSW